MTGWTERLYIAILHLEVVLAFGSSNLGLLGLGFGSILLSSTSLLLFLLEIQWLLACLVHLLVLGLQQIFLLYLTVFTGMPPVKAWSQHTWEGSVQSLEPAVRQRYAPPRDT